MSLKIPELSFILFAKDLKPGTIHPAVLQYLGLIPPEWELIENPVYSDRAPQVSLYQSSPFNRTAQSHYHC